jgi:hypothetical protein
MAFFYKDTVRPVMESLRAPVDELEMIVDKIYGQCLPMQTLCLRYKPSKINALKAHGIPPWAFLKKNKKTLEILK